MELRRRDLGKFPLWHSNVGWRARIGVVYPGAGFHNISDFHKLAPKGVGLGGCGVPRHKDESAESILHLDDKLIEMAKIVGASRPDALGWLCTGGSFMKGKGHDERLIREMEEATGIPSTTTSTAVMAAFRQLGMKRISICTPYPADVNAVEKKFMEDNGFTVVRCEGLELLDNDIIAHTGPGVIYRMAKAVDTPDADGVFISCTGLDALDAVEALEQDLGKPVVTSNLASYWMLFKMAGVGEPIQGYGRLMREPRHK